MEQDNKVLTIVIATFILVFVTNLPASIQEISDMLRQTQQRITMAEADINSGSLMSLAVKIKIYKWWHKIWSKSKDCVSHY